MIKLQLWEDKGLKQLNEFIHYLEISLSEAKQLYNKMSAQTQLKLEKNIYGVA